MKKFLKLLITGILLCSFLIPYTAFAESDEIIPEWQDIELSEEEFNAILENNLNNSISTYTTGLITTYVISCGKSGSNLVIAGKTNCIVDVVKCGFTVVTVERRQNSRYDWSTYASYSSLYNDTFAYNLSKTIAVTSGYQYRVTCTHYAKKSLLSTEKIANTSNVLIY